MKKLFPLLLAVIIMGLIAFTLMPKAESAPTFQLTDLNNQSISNADLNNRVTLINFWFPSCPGCVSEMPKLIKMAQDYQNKNFQIIGVAVPIDTKIRVEKYVAERQLPFRVAYDDNKIVTQKFVKTELFPTSVLINQRGEILKTFVGEPDFVQLYQQVDTELAK